ncbi:MAG: acetate/propionate family kinase [Burkholderiaceae bacterium]|nr:acetate/propionate family kinase [Sulfuritalea sp.]MCF8175393.1 acetate/propionate family kinase [Burkholderiaceae bacterium]
MADALLALNAGSSSIKFALFRHAEPVPAQPEFVGQIDGIGAAQRAHLRARDKTGRVLDDADLVLEDEHPHRAALDHLVAWLRQNAANWRIVGIGHRVVHGAEVYSHPIRLDDAHVARLREFIPLAPLHQPHSIVGIEAMRAALPYTTQVACFDTAFHRSQPPIAQMFALPRHITAQGVRRYGFHGLSYEYIAEVLPQHLGNAAFGRVIVAHLGNGASMCAMVDRKCQATTMGFTALDGLMMGTRTGAIDPGVVLYLMDHLKMDARAIEKMLYKESGLLGVSGISQDMRELLASEEAEAIEAVDLFCYRAAREVGSLASAIGGLDAIVFTGGIGERAAGVREKICRQISWLGLELDSVANTADDESISAPSSHVAILVLPTNEEWVLARHTARLIDASRAIETPL